MSHFEEWKGEDGERRRRKEMGKGGEGRRWGREQKKGERWEEKKGDEEGRRRKEMWKGGEEKCDWERKRRKEEKE